MQPLPIDTASPRIRLTVPNVTTDVFSLEEQASLYFTCIVKQWTSCAAVHFFIFLNTSAICFKQVNLIEMAEERKCDNKGDSSDKKR
jgi:hypothetical protein